MDLVGHFQVLLLWKALMQLKQGPLLNFQNSNLFLAQLHTVIKAAMVVGTTMLGITLQQIQLTLRQSTLTLQEKVSLEHANMLLDLEFSRIFLKRKSPKPQMP